MPSRLFGGPDAVLAYLSRYTHRIAIANSRLVAFDGERVTFKWKDYRAKRDARYKQTAYRDPAAANRAGGGERLCRGVSCELSLQLRQQQSLVLRRPGRSSVTVKKKRRAATALLMLGGCMPICVWCSWKRRRSSIVAVSGERPIKAANARTFRT